MSKTLVGLLEVAAVIWAQFVPGLNFVVDGIAVSSATVATAAVVLGEAILNATVLAPSSPKPSSAESSIKIIDDDFLHAMLWGKPPETEQHNRRASIRERFVSDRGQPYA